MPATSTIWKGQLTFGLVSFPVRLLKAARRERVPLKYVRKVKVAASPVDYRFNEPVDRDEAPDDDEVAERVEPVRRTFIPAAAEPVPVSASTAQESTIPASELQRGFQVASGNYAVISPDELRSLRAATSPDMQILRSVRMAEIDPVFLETSYNVAPDKGGERSYALFLQALHDTGYAALAQIAMHGREHIMIIRPAKHALIAHTMFYINEIRQPEEYSADVSEKELDLAKRFIEAIAEPFKPEEFTDRYREKLEALIASKTVTRQSAAAASEAPAPSNVVDIMGALRKSLEQAAETRRKPVGSAPAPQTKARKRKA